MTTLLSFAHYIVGLAIIGAVSGLAAVGTITGTDALSVIVGVGSLLLGGSLVVAGSTIPTTPTPAPAPPAA